MARQTAVPTTSSALFVLAGASLLQIALSSIQQGVPVLAVFFRQEMHLSLSQMGAMVSALYFGRTLGNIAAGPLVDRFGPRRLQGWGTLLVVVLTLLMVVLKTYLAVLGGLALLGAAISSGPITGNRSIFQVFSRERRGLAMGIRQAAVPLGGALAAVVIPPLLGGFGFIGVWLAMASVVSATGVLFGLVAPSGGSGTASKRLFAPFRDLRGAMFAWLYGLLMAAGQAATMSFVIVDLHGVFRWPIAQASTGLALALIGGGAGRMGWGWLSDLLGGRRTLILGIIATVGAASSLLMGWLPADVPTPLLLPLLFMLGFGTLGWNALNLTWASEQVKPAISGQALSWTLTSVSLGTMLDAPAFGSLVDLTHRFSLAWTAVSAILLLAALIALRAHRRDAESERRKVSSAVFS